MRRRQVVSTMFALLWSGGWLHGFAQSEDDDDPAALSDGDLIDEEIAADPEEDDAWSTVEDQDDAAPTEDSDDPAAPNDDNWPDEETTADVAEDDASGAAEVQNEPAQAEDGDVTPGSNRESTESAGAEQRPATPPVSDDGGQPVPDSNTGPNKVSERDAQAVALGYVTDAARLDKARYRQYAAGQSCATCTLFQGRATDAYGGCPLFGTKHVAARGWCTAWARRG